MRQALGLPKEQLARNHANTAGYRRHEDRGMTRFAASRLTTREGLPFSSGAPYRGLQATSGQGVGGAPFTWSTNSPMNHFRKRNSSGGVAKVSRWSPRRQYSSASSSMSPNC